MVGVSWRLVFVDDDSPDGTADVVKSISRDDDRVQCIRRVGRRGLAGAVIEGILASASPYVAVIDADLQHDETLLPKMLEVMRSGGADVVVGTRFQSADGLERGLSPVRRAGSRVATWAAGRVLRAEVSDPVSGFFMARRELVESVAPRLSPAGFKILFDIIASQPVPPRIVELPYAFAERTRGSSKLDAGVVADYAGLIVSKAFGGLILPVAVVASLWGCLAVATHMLVLIGLMWMGSGFLKGQTIAGVSVLVSGWFLVSRGSRWETRRSLSYLPWSSVGLVANIGVAALCFSWHASWPLAGFCGAAVGAMWANANPSR